jgi:hypothetical protein
LRNESSGGINNAIVAFRNSQHGGQCGFGEGELLPDKFA